MKDDPFSQLAGLDQRLFQEERTKRTTKQRDNETTSAHTQERDNVVSDKHSIERSSAPSKERVNEPTRTPASSPSGQTIRFVERHSHDIFQDQVRWINRVKLDIEEAHGQRITGNQLVQLAVDLLRRDYELNGDKSRLIRALVLRRPNLQGKGSS